MLINIFTEIPWQQFVHLDFIRNLPLNEQKVKYNQYLYELSIARSSWIEYQNKGPQQNFLLQENLDFLLQENGSKIIIT